MGEVSFEEANRKCRDELARLMKRDYAMPVESMVAQWAHEVSVNVEFPCIVIPTAAGMIVYPIPQLRSGPRHGKEPKP